MARIRLGDEKTRKDVILTASTKLFTEKGYMAASMRDLAESIGVEAASLYNHIRSKAELLHDICFNVGLRFVENMDKVESSDLRSIEKIEAILRFHIHEMIANYEEVFVSDNEWKHLSEPYLSDFYAQRRTYRKRFAVIIEQGVEAGEIKSIDVPTAVLVMLHAIGGVSSWHRAKQKISAQELEDSMITIMIDGLKK